MLENNSNNKNSRAAKNKLYCNFVLQDNITLLMMNTFFTSTQFNSFRLIILIERDDGKKKQTVEALSSETAL